MHLLTWHGTIVGQPDQTGIFVHRSLQPEGAGPDALSLNLPPDEGMIRHHELGTIEVRRTRQASTITLSRDGLFGCAELHSGKLVFDRGSAAAWENFLPITGQTLADLRHILAYRWIVRSTRRVVQRRTVGLAEGFRLHLGPFSTDLAEALDQLVTARGLNGLPIALAVPQSRERGAREGGGDMVELVVAEPRSSALIETAPWPVRSRRVAEIITLAVHRHLDGTEPTQEVFERDVGFLEANGGPPALEDFLEELTLSAAIERHHGSGGGKDAAPSIEIDAKLAAAQRHVEAGSSLAARAAFEQIVEAYPDDPRAWYRLGDLAHAAGDYTACQTAWERCLEIAPNHTEAAARLAYMAGSLGRPLDAIARLEAALAIEPRSVERRVFLAIRYAEMRWLDRAAEAFAAIEEPLRSWMEASRRDTGKNLAHHRETLARLVAEQERVPGGQNWNQIVQRARSAFALGELDLCTAAIDELLDQGADRPAPHLLRAEMILRTTSLEAALAYLDTLGDSFRADPDFVVARARLDYAAGHYERAEAALARLIAKTPRDDAFRLLALTALCMEDLPALGRATHAWMECHDRDTGAGIFAVAEARADGRLLRLDDLEAGVSDIPHPVIMQFWHAADIPPDVAQAMATWPEKNPGLGHLVFDDAGARAFLAEHCSPAVLDCYESAHHPAMQSDIFRLAYLNVRGGIYVDADDICTRDMRPVFAGLARADLIAAFSTETPPYVNNAFIAARAGCPIIAEALAEAVRVVAEHGAAGRRPDIWQVTGPGLLTRKIGRFAADPAHRGRVLLLTDGELHAFSITHDMRYKQTDLGDWRLDMPAPIARKARLTRPEASAGAEDVLMAWAMREMAPWQADPVGRADAALLHEELNHKNSWMALYRFENGLVTMGAKPDDPPPSQLIRDRAETYLQFLRSVARLLPADFRTSICVGLGDGLPQQYAAPVFCFQKTSGWNTPLLPDPDFITSDFYERKVDQDEVPYEMKRAAAVFAGAATGGIITPEVARNLSLPRLRAARYFAGSEQVDFRITNIAQCATPEAEALLRAQPFCLHKPMSRQEQFQYRFLLSMDGNGATWSRVVIALLSHCVLLKYDSPQTMYFYGGLQPWLHYVPIAQDSDVERILAMEAADPARFARIAAHGRAFAQAYLNADCVKRYTALLLQRYEAMFTDKPASARPAMMARYNFVPSNVVAGSTLAHIQNRGDRRGTVGDWMGEPGSGLAIEGFAITLGNEIPASGFTYQAVAAQGGFSEPCVSGEYCGTRGRNRPLHGVCITAAEGMELEFEARFVDGTESGPVPSGTKCTARSGKALEAIRVCVRVPD